MKEHKNSLEEELDEMEASNLSNREFTVMTKRIFNSMKKDVETINKGHSEIKNTVSVVSNTLDGINTRGSNQCFGR